MGFFAAFLRTLHMRMLFVYAFSLLIILSNFFCIHVSVQSAYAAQQWNYARPGLPLNNTYKTPGASRTRSNFGEGEYAGGTLQLQNTHDWRLQIRTAAAVAGEMVTLADIADPHGPIPIGLWDSIKNQPLWPAPPEPGKPLQINKARLGRALRDTLGDVASKCVLPASLAIQRGGVVLTEHDLRKYVVGFLTPQTNAMPGTAEWTEFRLPPYIFLAHGQQRVNLEPGRVAPGRVTFRFVIQEPDGRVVRRAAGAAFLNLWVEVPAAARPLNQGDALHVDDITFVRVNAAHLTAMPWDGKGGPWQMVRSVGMGQTIYSTDLLGVSMVRKGSIVNLIYAKGNIRIEVKAECLADGAPGTIIPVRNLHSKKQVYATIRDSKTVMAD